MRKLLYNGTDPFASAWLCELIAAGHLPPGDVSETSIVGWRLAATFIQAVMGVL